MIACRDALKRRPPIKRLVADLRAGDDGARLSVIELALAAHAAATAGLCLFVAHVEIATQLLACGCLPFSWALASVLIGRSGGGTCSFSSSSAGSALHLSP